MARELIIKIHCDMCGHSIEENETHSGELIIDGATYGIDLCEGDSLGLTAKLTPKAKALKQDEIPPTKAGHSTPKIYRQVPCDVPGCDVKVKNSQGLSMHKRRVHPEIFVSKKDQQQQLL